MKFIISKTVISTLLLINLYCLNSCKNTQIDNSLVSYIDSCAKEKSGLIKISDFEKVDWDKLYIIHPYTQSTGLPFPLSEYQSKIMRTGIDKLDNFYILALTNGDKLVELAKIPVSIVHFADLARYKKIGKTSVLTYYKRSEDNFSWHNDLKGNGNIIVGSVPERSEP